MKLQVEKVFSASHPDPREIEKAKKVLKVRTTLFFYMHYIKFFCCWDYDWFFKLQEHEQALIDAIATLEDASDGESGNN